MADRQPRRSERPTQRPRAGKPVLLGNHQKCWLWGRHAVLETVRADYWPILELHLADDVNDEVLPELVDYIRRHPNVRFYRSPSARLAALGRSEEHQGFLAKMPPFPYRSAEELLAELTTGREPTGSAAAPLCVLLDRLHDPHNFGAIVRSAYGLGVEGLFVGTKGQVEVTAQVARSSAGAVNRLPIGRAGDLLAFAATFKQAGCRLIGTSQHARQPVFDCDLTGPVAIVIGNEGEGIRPELLALCDAQVAIPQTGQLESLNAAVSAGILFYEARRQRVRALNRSG